MFKKQNKKKKKIKEKNAINCIDRNILRKKKLCNTYVIIINIAGEKVLFQFFKRWNSMKYVKIC